MKLQNREVEMTTYLVLSERETQMLGYLASYGGKEIAKAICEKLTTRFTPEEWERFWQEMRSVCESSFQRFKDTRMVFSGERVAGERPTKG